MNIRSLKMKKLVLLFALCGTSALATMAQDDDLYFTPKKVAKSSAFDDNSPAYYVGSDRPVDEYNRRGQFRSSYVEMEGDTIADGVVRFEKGKVVYPDSTYEASQAGGLMSAGGMRGYDYDDDYLYTRRMGRWEGFYSPWYYGWHSPFWYGSYGYYDPWYWDYAGWYSPWYYGYGGWYDPWYYGGYWGYRGWYGWYDPWYRPGWGGGFAVRPSGSGRTIAGTRNHGDVTGRSYGTASSRFGSRTNYGTATTQTPVRFGSRSASTANRGYTTSRSDYSNNNNTYTAPSTSYAGNRSYSSGSSSSSGSFGGSRSGGGGFSGGHSGGGAHFGGRR